MRAQSSQRGATLVVALIVLVVLTLFALSAYTTSSMNLKTTFNTQMRAEAQSAAQEAIDHALSSSKFVTTPGDIVANPCGAANTLCPDFSGDGVADYTVRLTPAPSCKKAEPVASDTLDPRKSADLSCITGQSQQWGVSGVDTSAGESLCSNTVWELTAEATSTLTGAKVVISQGVGIQVPRAEAQASCL
jgi:Tfp pilus assembly protein PilX